MNLFCDSFEINGVSSSSLGLCVVAFDFDDSVDTAQSLDVNSARVGLNPRSKLLSLKYSDVLKFSISVIKSDSSPFTVLNSEQIHRWLTTNNYTQLTCTGNSLFNQKFFNVITQNIVPEKANNKIIGYTFYFECDSPYAYNNVSNSNTLNSWNYHIPATAIGDEILNVDYGLPMKLTITASSNVQSSFDFTITNLGNNKETVITDMVADETVVIDSETYTITSNVRDNMYEYFNGVFPVYIYHTGNILNGTYNDINVARSVPGDTVVTREFNMPVKVGW